MPKAYTLNDPPGSFRVFAPDGNSAFDSRLATQLLHMQGTALVAQPSSVEATTFIPYAKVFTKIPYVRSAARLFEGNPGLLEAKDFYPPRLNWNQNIATSQQFFQGNHTAAQLGGVLLASQWLSQGRLRFVYAIFENQAGG